MENCFLSSIHISFGDLGFNLLAVKCGEPVNLQKTMHIAFRSKFALYFGWIPSKPQIYFLFHQTFLWMITLSLLWFVLSLWMIIICPDKPSP